MGRERSALLQIFSRHHAGIDQRVEAALAEVASFAGQRDAAAQGRGTLLVGGAVRVVVAAAGVLDLLAVGGRFDGDEDERNRRRECATENAGTGLAELERVAVLDIVFSLEVVSRTSSRA